MALLEKHLKNVCVLELYGRPVAILLTGSRLRLLIGSWFKAVDRIQV